MRTYEVSTEQVIKYLELRRCALSGQSLRNLPDTPGEVAVHMASSTAFAVTTLNLGDIEREVYLGGLLHTAIFTISHGQIEEGGGFDPNEHVMRSKFLLGSMRDQKEHLAKIHFAYAKLHSAC